jgi:glucuronyl esterase-like protein
MIRFSRALKENVTHAVSFVSLIALVACGASEEPSDPAGTPSQTPGDTAGGTAGTQTPPTSEGNPTGVPLTPGEPVGFVEDSGADCDIGPIPTSADLQELTTLPDPFLALNGERLTTKAEWRCRREEIRKLAERFMYGEKPSKPETVTGTVSDTSISVEVQSPAGSASFTATVTLPPGATGPVPAVIGYGGSVFQPAMAEEGVAYINFNVTAVGDETTNNPKVGAFYTVNPERQDTGMLVAWGWGLSRIIDVIEASGAQIINPRAIGVTGCSRSGKGAFIAGAFDERVALTLPLESGMAGVAAFRLVGPEPGSEVLRNAYEYRPWAGEAYRQFLSLMATSQDDTAGRALDQMLSDQLLDKLPFDTHEIIGMVAPRGLLVMGNPGISLLAPNAELVSVLAGAKIYAALGVEQNISYISNTAIGDHCGVLRPEYIPLLQQNLRKFLKGDASATTGEINPDPRLTGELAPNIAWEAPALQ